MSLCIYVLKTSLKWIESAFATLACACVYFSLCLFVLNPAIMDKQASPELTDFKGPTNFKCHRQIAIANKGNYKKVDLCSSFVRYSGYML